MMFECGQGANIRYQIDAINSKYDALYKGKSRQQIIELNEQRKLELCRLNPKYGR